MGMFFQEYDPRVGYFDSVIHRITDTGIIDRLFRKALPFTDIKDSIKVEEEALILEHFAIPPIVCLAGLAIGVIILLAEKCKISFSSRFKRHNTTHCNDTELYYLKA